MLITTMNDVPGHRITQVYGEVFGLTVRSRHLGSQIGAGLKSMMGGNWTEICAYGTAVRVRKG